MFTKDSRILNHRLTVPLTSVSKAVGDVFKPTFEQLIKPLFANNEQGFAYDPNDLSTMFQDAAGTVPVTGAGQPVGLIRDKSGRNNHAYQTTSASRPILRQNAITGAYYLGFDGSDDFLVTNNIDFTSTNKVSLFTAVQNLSNNSQQFRIVFELSQSGAIYDGTFTLTSPHTYLDENQYSSKGSIRSSNMLASIQDTKRVISARSSISSDTNNLRVNGVLKTLSSDQGTGNYGNYPLYIGRRGGSELAFNGHIYGLIGVGKLASDNEIAVIEKELAKRTGVTLSV